MEGPHPQLVLPSWACCAPDSRDHEPLGHLLELQIPGHGPRAADVVRLGLQLGNEASFKSPLVLMCSQIWKLLP